MKLLNVMAQKMPYRLLEKLLSLRKRVVRHAYSAIQRPRFRSFGKRSTIGFGCILHQPRSISIGNGVSIGRNVWLNADIYRDDDRPSLIIGDGTFISDCVHINAFKDVVIESHVLIGENVYLGDTDHLYQDKDIPIIQQGWEFKGPVLLKTGCYIAKGSIVLPGVTIGRNAVVGPNTVVTMDVKDHTLVWGNPARVMKINN